MEQFREKYNSLARWNPSTFPRINHVFNKLLKSLFSGIGEIVNDLFIFEKMESFYVGNDIYQKLKILKHKSSRFRVLAGFFFQLRNIVIHHGVLKIDLMQNITNTIISLFEANLVFWCDNTFNNFSDEWINIYNIILIDAPQIECFCEDSISDTFVLEELMHFPLSTEEPMSLKYYRNNGYKEVLKGKNVRILDGKWSGRNMILLNWCGSAVKFQFNNIKMLIPIDRLIKIL